MPELSADDTAAFGRAVTARRAELGLSRKDVAARSGLSYPYVSNIEAGHKQPSAKALHVLAAALELRPAELLERSESLARLARTTGAARADDDGTLSRGSWFRGELGAPPPPASLRREDEMRALVRELVREELGHATGAQPLSPMDAARPRLSMSPMAPPPLGQIPPLAPAIAAALPPWLSEPADSAADLAIQSVVLERLHRLPADAPPDEVQRTIDDALDHLIKQARRHRRRKPKPQ
jgi:transcriptional regulator with XRE-family HTH domain